MPDRFPISRHRRYATGPDPAGSTDSVRSLDGVIDPSLRALALATKGFMPADEGDALHAAALAAGRAVPGAPWIEVGSYCGRSTIWLGDAARRSDTVVFAVDHHRGSEENQSGWEHHDAEVVDDRIGKMDTLPFFRRAIHDAGLEDVVFAVVGPSPRVAAAWTTPLFLYQPGYSDIVPMYCLFLAAAPGAVLLSMRGHAGACLAASAGLWLAAQLGLSHTLFAPISIRLGLELPGVRSTEHSP